VRLALCLTAAAFLTAAPARAGEVVEVKIDQLAYAPTKITAHVGDTVEWKNGDFVAHTATATGGAFDVMIPAGATRRLLLKEAGSFPYYCRFHPNMKGELTVM
jgi:plastocyanin